MSYGLHAAAIIFHEPMIARRERKGKSAGSSEFHTGNIKQLIGISRTLLVKAQSFAHTSWTTRGTRAVASTMVRATRGGSAGRTSASSRVDATPGAAPPGSTNRLLLNISSIVVVRSSTGSRGASEGRSIVGVRLIRMILADSRGRRGRASSSFLLMNTDDGDTTSMRRRETGW